MRLRHIVCAIVLLICAATSAEAATYTVTDLGATQAYALNDMGQIAGWNSELQGAVLRDPDGTLTPIPSLANTSCIFPYAINNAGVVVGMDYLPAFRWSRETGTQWLESSSDWKCPALAVNDGGMIVGRMSTYESDYAVIWGLDGAASAIGSTIYRGQAEDINNSGQVVGWADGHGFVWTEEDEMADLGSFSPTAISNTGIIVGSANSQACIWQNGIGAVALPQVTGGLTSFAVDINDRGQIVGTEVIDYVYHAMLWNPDGSVVDFGRCDSAEMNRVDINNSGQIAFGNRLFTPVPEPSALLTLLCGIGAILARRRRRLS